MTCPDCGGSGDFEILNSGMGSAVCLVCGGTGDSGGVKMEQLWVAYLIDEQGHVAYAYRHPTDAEVLAYAATLDGAVSGMRCQAHNADGVPRLGRDPFTCWKAEFTKHLDPADCRMVEGRWVPLPDKEMEVDG